MQHEQNQERSQQTGGVAFQGHASLKSGPYQGSDYQNQRIWEPSPIKENGKCTVCKMWNVGCNGNRSIC